MRQKTFVAATPPLCGENGAYRYKPVSLATILTRNLSVLQKCWLSFPDNTEASKIQPFLASLPLPSVHLVLKILRRHCFHLLVNYSYSLLVVINLYTSEHPIFLHTEEDGR